MAPLENAAERIEAKRETSDDEAKQKLVDDQYDQNKKTYEEKRDKLIELGHNGKWVVVNTDGTIFVGRRADAVEAQRGNPTQHNQHPTTSQPLLLLFVIVVCCVVLLLLTLIRCSCIYHLYWK